MSRTQTRTFNSPPGGGMRGSWDRSRKRQNRRRREAPREITQFEDSLIFPGCRYRLSARFSQKKFYVPFDDKIIITGRPYGKSSRAPRIHLQTFNSPPPPFFPRLITNSYFITRNRFQPTSALWNRVRVWYYVTGILQCYSCLVFS